MPAAAIFPSTCIIPATQTQCKQAWCNEEPNGGDTVGIKRFAQGEQGIEAFGKEGQILYRKLDQATGLPAPDTDTAADWAWTLAEQDSLAARVGV